MWQECFEIPNIPFDICLTTFYIIIYVSLIEEIIVKMIYLNVNFVVLMIDCRIIMANESFLNIERKIKKQNIENSQVLESSFTSNICNWLYLSLMLLRFCYVNSTNYISIIFIK